MTNDVMQNTEELLRSALTTDSSLVGQPFDNGFYIDNKMAERIILTECPDKLKNYELKYTLDMFQGDMHLIAILPDGTVDFTVKLRKSANAVPVQSMDLKASLERLKERTERYKSMQRKLYTFVGISVAIAMVVAFTLVV